MPDGAKCLGARNVSSAFAAEFHFPITLLALFVTLNDQFMRKFLSDLYLTGFAVFFDLGVYNPSARVNASKSVALLTLLEWQLCLTAWMWMDIFFKANFLFEFSKWTVRLLTFAAFAANYFYLVKRRHGIAYMKEFTGLEKRKKSRLVMSLWAMVIFIAALFMYSVIVHRRFISRS